MTSGVYSIRCRVTGQRYVGTGIDWRKRVNSHLRKLVQNKHKNKRLQQAWNTHGAVGFGYRLLEVCPIDRLLERERYWADFYGSIANGFNDPQLGSNGALTHGASQSKTFKSWDMMIQRCTNPNAPDYPRYGGAGITICNRWRNSFEVFLANMGERPEGTSLDRYPNKNGNYEPDNCRWATATQQQRNINRNVWVTHGGKTQLAVDWSRETGIPEGILRRRVKQGITGDQLFASTYSTFQGVKRNTDYMKKQITAFGRTQTMEAWAKELSINLLTLKTRLGRGMPIEKALSSKPLQKGKKGPREGKAMITAFGKTQSLTNWARETGIPTSTLKNRIVRASMHPEDALSAPLYAQQREKRIGV